MPTWKAAYRAARIDSRDVTSHASRRALSITIARQRVGRTEDPSIGRSAAWLRIAGELRALGRLEAARTLVAEARRSRPDTRPACACPDCQELASDGHAGGATSGLCHACRVAGCTAETATCHEEITR